MNKYLTEENVQDVNDFVVQELKVEFIQQDPRNLNMPGLVETLTFIAVKVVIPIIVSIAGRYGYDKLEGWRKGNIKKEEIIKDVTATPLPQKIEFDKVKLIADISKDLESQGIPNDKAKLLIEKTIEKVNSYYSA